MITNFPQKKFYNPGGYRGFQFTHADAVSVFPSIKSGAISAPYSFVSGNTWLNGYATKGTLIFDEPSSDSDNGPFYTQEITGFVPGDYPGLTALMDAMDGQPFIVKLTDPAGRLRVVGTHGYPLIFTSKFNSGGNRPDARGYTFKFSGQSIFRAPAYNG